MNKYSNLVRVYRVCGLILVALILGFFLGCSSSKDDALISQIKGSTLSDYSGKTIGKAVDSFFGSPKWTVQWDKDQNEYVTITGGITYSGKDVTAALQFKVDKSNSYFEINALELNGIPQNQLMIDALLQKMYATNTDGGSE